jgi:hypothetical protein
MPVVSQEERILCLLQAAWPSWTPAPELARISLQYSARIFSLRRNGWLIENRVRVVDGVRHGEFRLGSADPVEWNCGKAPLVRCGVVYDATS